MQELVLVLDRKQVIKKPRHSSNALIEGARAVFVRLQKASHHPIYAGWVHADNDRAEMTIEFFW